MILRNSVGKLWEVRWQVPMSVREAEEFLHAKSAAMDHTTGALVICSDLRRAHLLPIEIMDRLIEVLRHDNPRIQRHALILGASPMQRLQIRRMVRETGGGARREFRDVQTAIEWLEPVLDTSERVRLRDFVAESSALHTVGRP